MFYLLFYRYLTDSYCFYSGYIAKLAGKKIINQSSHSQNFDITPWIIFNHKFYCRPLAASFDWCVHNGKIVLPGEKPFVSVLE